MGPALRVAGQGVPLGGQPFGRLARGWRRRLWHALWIRQRSRLAERRSQSHPTHPPSPRQVYVTLQMHALRQKGQAAFEAGAALRPWGADDSPLCRAVDRVLTGADSGDEQLSVVFDRALATRGASGGEAARQVTLAPQFVPLSQLVLLTLKAAAEQAEQGDPG